MHNKSNNYSWVLLWLALVLFGVVAVMGFLNRSYSVAQKNVLQLSLAFNDLENALHVFLTSRQMDGLDDLQAAKDHFDSMLAKIKRNEITGSFTFMPRKVSQFLAGSDLSKYDFTKINVAWGETQEQINYIIDNAPKYEAFQQAISATQQKNKIMQGDYKRLIGFLLDNYFSGNKVAVVQRQPWLADRISIRLLWLQRPLAFSQQGLKVLKSEAQLFSKSGISLLEQNLAEVATESEELNTILTSTKASITQYINALNVVVKRGDILIKDNLPQIIHGNKTGLVDNSLVTTLNGISKDVASALFSPALLRILFTIAFLLGLFATFNLYRLRNKQMVGAGLVDDLSPLRDEQALVEAEAKIQQHLADKSELEENNRQLKIAVEEGEQQLEKLNSELQRKEQMMLEQQSEQSIDVSPLLGVLQQASQGDISVQLDAQDAERGDVAIHLNQLLATMRQLVQAVDICADQTRLIADQRMLLTVGSNNLDGHELLALAQSVNEKFDVLDLNLRIGDGEDLSEATQQISFLTEEVGQLRNSFKQLNQQLQLAGADDSQQQAASGSTALFDDLQTLSDKLKSIASRFKVS